MLEFTDKCAERLFYIQIAKQAAAYVQQPGVKERYEAWLKERYKNKEVEVSGSGEEYTAEREVLYSDVG